MYVQLTDLEIVGMSRFNAHEKNAHCTRALNKIMGEEAMKTLSGGLCVLGAELVAIYW